MPNSSVFDKIRYLYIYLHDRKYLVVNRENGKYFATNAVGYRILKKFISLNEDEFFCNKKESLFFQKINTLNFWKSFCTQKDKITNVLCINCTSNCNLSCSYCYFNAKASKKSSDILLNKQEKEKFINFLKVLKKQNKYLKIYLTGGEPLLYPQLMEMISIIKSLDIYLGLVSNSTLLSTEILHKFKELNLNEIRISLDSVIKKEHDLTRDKSFDIVIDKLKTLDFSDILVTISSTITKINENSINQLLSFVKDKKYGINFSIMLPVGRGVENQNLLPNYQTLQSKINKSLRKHGFPLDDYNNVKPINSCGFANKSLALSLNGNLYPCNMLSNSKYLLGNIFNEKVVEILKNSNKFSKSFNPNNLDKCKDCGLIKICGGGCRAAAYQTTNDLFAQSPECLLKYNEILTNMFDTAIIIKG